MRTHQLNATLAVIALLSLGLQACGPSGGGSSGGSAAADTSAQSQADLMAKAMSPVFCQNPPYDLDNPLPACPTPPVNTCPHSQVPNNAGKCVDYVCDVVVELHTAVGTKTVVPDRDPDSTHGKCYALKLMDAIANSVSNLTTAHDKDVVTRNHDIDAGDVHNHWNPYLMARANVDLLMPSAHQVDFAGDHDDLTPVRVDNLFVVGISPVIAGAPVKNGFYGAFGTSDCSTLAAGDSGKNVLFKNLQIPITAFASGGTASIGPLSVTDNIQTGVEYQMDIRAEDCGSMRELSAVWIVFR